MSDYDTGVMAEMYAAWGWSVFPLWWADQGECACPRRGACTSPGKHPLTRNGVHDASSDVVAIRSWWLKWPLANVGLPAGANGLAVLDVDPRHGGTESLVRLSQAAKGLGRPLPATLVAVTGSGGQHLVYAAPEGGIKGGAQVFGPDMPGLDTRGRGGYIVAAPSTHASGQRYEWANILDRPVPWPDVLTALMEPEPVAAPRPAGRRRELDVGDQYALTAMREEASRVRQAPEGSRNHTLNRAAFALGQLVQAGLLDADVVVAELAEAAAEAGLSVTETRSTLRSGLRGGAAKPREELP